MFKFGKDTEVEGLNILASLRWSDFFFNFNEILRQFYLLTL